MKFLSLKSLLVYILLLSTLVSTASCGIFSSDDSETDPPISVKPFAPSDDPLRVSTDAETTGEPSVVPNPETTKGPAVTEPNPIVTTPPETTAPPVTTAPETEPIKGRNMSLSGRINPKDSNNIELHLEWSATQKADSPYATVTVSVFLDSYEIYAGARDNCKLTLDGQEITFYTDIVSRKSEKFGSSHLYTGTFEVLSPAGERINLPVSAEFYFGGTYGKKTFGWISVDGTITLKDTSSYVPSTPKSPNTPS